MRRTIPENWLAQSGLPAAFPQIVTEWNRWTTFPDWYDKSREGALGAANYIATLHAMDRAGIRSQTVAALQDFNAPPRNQAFIGDFGLVTREPMVKKASFHALNLLALLEPGRIRATVPEQEGEAQGVDVLATGNAGKMAILVSRFANDPQGSVVRSLRNRPADAPDTPAGKGGINGEQLGAYLQRKTELAEFNLPPKSRDALAQARKQYDLARTPAGDLPLRINIRGRSGPTGTSST